MNVTVQASPFASISVTGVTLASGKFFFWYTRRTFAAASAKSPSP